jgi:mannonate dehydratase
MSPVNRRTVLRLPAALAAAGLSPALEAEPQGRMKLATQHDSSDATLRIMAAFGVNHICSTLPSKQLDQNWSVDSLTKLRERVESFGLRLEMVPLPLSSAYITKAEMPSIMLAQEPERSKAIDDICQMIRNCSKAAIPCLKYNMSILGVVRTESTKGRGGAAYSTFVYDKAVQDPPLTEAGRVTAEIYWERIEYFLKRVAPVAAEYKVRIACHPHDPGMPPGLGYRGCETVLGSVEGLKRFVSISDNPYHGLNFCQGTVTEMLKDPNKEIHDVIRYFGSRKKIFNVHFRNIEGGFLNFRETFPDNGSVNFIDVIRTYKAVGYDGMLMPDHVPKIQGDEGGRQAFAYCFGYIQALIQSVYS